MSLFVFSSISSFTFRPQSESIKKNTYENQHILRRRDRAFIMMSNPRNAFVLLSPFKLCTLVEQVHEEW